MQQLKQTLTSLGMVPAVCAVPIPFFPQYLVDGKFEPNDIMIQGARDSLDELLELHQALTTIR